MSVIPLLLMLGIFYAFLIVPQRKKQRAQRELLSNISAGDEILTSGGIYGGVVEVDGENLFIDIAPNVEIKISRRAVAERVYIAGSDDKAGSTPPTPTPALNTLSKFLSRKKA